MEKKNSLSVIKADIGSIGGHIQPSVRLLEKVRDHVAAQGKDLIIDSYISYTGDDIAIVSTHRRGINDAQIHKMAWDAFMAGTATARSQEATSWHPAAVAIPCTRAITG